MPDYVNPHIVLPAKNGASANCEGVKHQLDIFSQGAILVLGNAMGGWGIKFSEKRRYGGLRFNVISITRGWPGV